MRKKKQQKTSAAAIAKANHRAKAVALRLSGHTLDEIAAKLGISNPSVHRLLMTAISKTEDKEKTQELRATMESRLEAMIKARWQRFIDGDHAAGEFLLKVLTRQAKLFGLDAPAQIQATVSTGPAPEQVDAIRKLISDPRGRELLLAQDRLLAEIDAREKADAVNPPIDVECVECTSLAVVDSVPDLSSEPIAVDDPGDPV